MFVKADRMAKFFSLYTGDIGTENTWIKRLRGVG